MTAPFPHPLQELIEELCEKKNKVRRNFELFPIVSITPHHQPYR